MQSEASIRQAASDLDEALQAGDLDRVVACFSEECTVELLGVRLHGHDGVRRWLDWVFAHVERIEFAPRVISVDGDTFIEEFGVTGILADGRLLNSQWAEILTYRDELVTSLRLYFNPIDFAPALGMAGRAIGPAAARFARRGLEPFEPMDDTR
ncbi:MAG: nuclear transport factor 2 family protein [Actinomycetota bacterium]|nr:nuclear transport factor 2 family protein [Actinomycetota bacterium]